MQAELEEIKLYHLLPVPVSLVFIVLYLKARKENDLKRVAFIQPVGTVIAVLIASLSMLTPGFDPVFTLIIIIGLLLALVGDINNIDMTDEKTVMIGLISDQEGSVTGFSRIPMFSISNCKTSPCFR